MNTVTRRQFLHGAGGLSAFLVSGAVWAQGGADRLHRPVFDLPILAEDGSAVPVALSVDHPMDPDHYIRSIEVVLETDPVPRKGKFHFTPSNGRASVAFQMRSGVGGTLKAIVECSRHGLFTGTQEVRVVPGGCTVAPDKVAKERLGNPMLRLPRSIRRGEVIEVRAKVDHNSYTGLAERNGRFVREQPEFYVKSMVVYLGDRKVSEYEMTSAISPNPLVRFPLKPTEEGLLRVVFVNSEGQRWETSQPVRFSG